MTRTRITARARAEATVALALALAVTLTGCNSETGGTPAAAPPTSTTASSTTTTTSRSATTTTTPAAQAPGLRTDAIAPTVTIIETEPGAVNEVAKQALSDVIGYWQNSGLTFTPPQRLEAMDGPVDGSSCMSKLSVARRCDNGIGWETADLATIQSAAGDLGVLTILAHEVGHEVQSDNHQRDSERGADCLAGVYLQTVANGSSKRFVGTRSDIESAASTTFDLFKGAETAPTSDRMEALQAGLDSSASHCFIFYP